MLEIIIGVAAVCLVGFTLIFNIFIRKNGCCGSNGAQSDSSCTDCSKCGGCCKMPPSNHNDSGEN